MKILVANKSDIPEQEIPEAEGQALADEHKMEFYTTSARTGANIENMFEDIAFKVMTRQQLKKEQQARALNNFSQVEQVKGSVGAAGNVNLNGRQNNDAKKKKESKKCC